ncbi:phosphoribosylamine--glycine ligase [Natronobacterium gregoryi]|uniref:Phosphoribosylamine--glycine ligase n=2 Tax=Natronobacterium gregoryi TaxID=44930 RepID=L0AN33_NATGS|nr:phosphoribosylamine--glycine ligase [Natronobacterium gregoryi]AFZ74490.1 phosphoribosylamine--glycine ligase [Natronobacterium gregoryi SP2]ELY72436.1 phosphoribosylamine--glycine ligase [Natronobacterium gregoryi SP2]PLK21764.1 phosphoribosylamine--glycine ligase [Natronobacterium gregoryi SP2]SFI98671.1 phosphoribosylamine--glycine ligase [Natronobacterium gregoryi]
MSETVLLIGGGGREHAIARALKDSDDDLYACAGNRNPGIDRIADGFETLETTDPDAVVDYAESVGATIGVVGPESPLEAGVADALEEAGIYAFGPKEEDARIETDKAFQRRFMQENDVPGCPDFETFDDVEAACEFIDEYDGDLAIKPAGLTGGKGVRVIGDQVTPEEGKAYIRESDYDRIVLEERLIGEEFTIQAFVANETLETAPAVQDHKRAYEGDAGPNTGGMGSYSDATTHLPFMTEADYEAAVSIIEATVDALDEYRGILYGQFMLTADGPKVVEFNARFGDPEAMNTLPVLETDFLDVLTAARDGEPIPKLEFTDRATVCKYAVPEGYPTDPAAGAKVEVDEESAGDALLYYASVDERDDGIYTTTSRAFAVVGVADSITEAEEIAEDALAVAGDEGLHVRHDIGTPDLVQQRIDHVNTLRDE